MSDSKLTRKSWSVVVASSALSCALLAASVPAIAAHAPSPLKSLNAAIANLIAPLQDASTQANLAFSRIKTDDTRALKLSLSGDFKKSGTANTVELRINRLSYDYGDGTQPTTRFKAFVGVDLTQLIPQDELSRMIPGIQQTLQDFVNTSYQEYGTAAKVTVKTFDEKKDAQGSYVSLRAIVSLHIDLTQLPSGTPASEVPLTDATAHLGVNIAQGVTLSGSVISNPAYEGFQDGQTGLKQYLDQLLSQDPDTMREISSAFSMLNDIATAVVNGNAGAIPFLR